MDATPAWDPRQYLRHAGHRTRPFHDLVARVPELPRTPARIADLGCGPGTGTALLAALRPDARITGLDNSPDMLAAATAHTGPTGGGGRIDFAHANIGAWEPTETFDLIISNAALHWVPGHTDAFPRWADALTPGGTLAFQVPGNHSAPSHTILRELCEEPRWRQRLGAARTGSAREPADYLAHLSGLGLTADVWETTYLQLLPGEDPVLDWLKGTTLRPVLTALADDPGATEEFLHTCATRLRKAYPRGPHGTVFPFRRIFAVARKPAPSPPGV
ncbi:trans-aconitate 2-methyltransferase [Streptomyces sp. NPDC046215]|uniref:Trans-aconitate 2-methyltransferase n=1 Tax=Streptomyces stramineus TaxID=173861 RepID=A0ABP3JCZ1_9ACTN